MNDPASPPPPQRGATTLTPQQRQAQRVIVGIVRGGAAQLHEAGWRVWRHPDAGEWQASAEEIAAHLDVLEVPYTVAVVRRRHSRRSPAAVTGLEIRVATADLPALLRWVPSLQQLMDAVTVEPR